MRATKRGLRILVIAYAIVLAWGIWATRHIDSDIVVPASLSPAPSLKWEAATAQGKLGVGIVEGHANTPKASRSRAPRTSSRDLTSGRLTDTTCYVWTGNRTASGTWPKVGDAASNRYPFGTVLQVERVGRVVVRDRIGHSSSLDIFFADRASCLRFGRQQLRVQVVR